MAKNRKTKYVLGMVQYIAIVSGEEILKNNTNEKVLGRILRDRLDKHFTLKHITKFEKVKYLGPSLATE